MAAILIRRKDAKGCYSATDAKVMATDNQNVRPKSVPARIRRARHLLARVTRKRLVQWWLSLMKMVFEHWRDPRQVKWKLQEEINMSF